jgi:hypothetical protein
MPCDAPVDYSRRKYHRQPEGTVAQVANPFQADWKETGRQGMKDLDEIIPLLHRLRRPTFFTHDLGFFDHALCHKGYTLICLDVRAKETAVYSPLLAPSGVSSRETTVGESHSGTSEKPEFLGNRKTEATEIGLAIAITIPTHTECSG